MTDGTKKANLAKLNTIAEQLGEIAEELWIDSETHHLGFDITLTVTYVQAVTNCLTQLIPDTEEGR